MPSPTRRKPVRDRSLEERRRVRVPGSLMMASVEPSPASSARDPGGLSKAPTDNVATNGSVLQDP